MYKLSDTIYYDNDLWKVERRFIAGQNRQYDNLPSIDHVTVVQDYDTNMVYTLIGCHADDYGCLSCESQLDKVLDCLYCPMLLVCHPGLVSYNYSGLWDSVSYIGYWNSQTIAFTVDGIIYVCSQVV